MADANVKLRSVCQGCTAAKVRCSGKTPCDRCVKKRIECVYMPFKNRGGGDGGNGGNNTAYVPTAAIPSNQISTAEENLMSDILLDEYEKRSWSVFFTLFKTFGKGCSLFWFTHQLFKMLHFLEERAATEKRAATALHRLTSWMTALGIDVNNPPTESVKMPPDFKFSAPSSPIFQSSVDELLSYSKKRDLPTLHVSRDGKVTMNAAFESMFGVTKQQLEKTLDSAAGGFLPWCGDLVARIVAREADLILYLQGVSNNLEAIGKPTNLPCTVAIPSMSVLRVVRGAEKKESLCILRSVQHLELATHSFAYGTTLVLDFPEDETPESSSKTRPFSEMNGSDVEDDSITKRMQLSNQYSTDPSLILSLPLDLLSVSGGESYEDDNAWLDNLLTWAADDPSSAALDTLPIADEAQ